MDKDTRYCFMADDDGHWYLVEVKNKKKFIRLLYDEEDCGLFDEEFYDMNLGMHVSNYSFVDAKEITEEGGG